MFAEQIFKQTLHVNYTLTYIIDTVDTFDAF